MAFDTRHGRLILLAVLILAGSFGLSIVQNYLAWGYWMNRSTLASEIMTMDRLLALSVYESPSPSSTSFVVEDTRSEATRIALAACEQRFNECRDGMVLKTILTKWPLSDSAPQVNKTVTSESFTQCLKLAHQPETRRSRGFDRPSEPNLPSTWPGGPLAGFAAVVSRDDVKYAFVPYRTRELSDDRYFYGEILCRLDPTGVVHHKSAGWFLEIAGFEGFDWKVFWVVNAGLCLLAGALVLMRVDSAKARWIVAVVLSIPMTIAITGLLWFAAFVQTPRWSVVALLSAAPLLVTATVMLVRLRAHWRNADVAVSD
jgi:hypothetical protein